MAARKCLGAFSRSSLRAVENCRNAPAARWQCCAQPSAASIKGRGSTSASLHFDVKPSAPASMRRFSTRISGLPGELGALQSFLPFYSATANSRLVSRISSTGDLPVVLGSLLRTSPDS